MAELRRIAHICRLNKVIWLLTFSDIFSWGIYGSVSALVGIYLSNKLGFNAIEVVGVGVGIYYLTRAIASIPVGLVTDKIKKDRDDITLLTVGNLLMGLSLIFYPIILSPGIYYVLQVVFGLGAALNLVTWRKLFTRNLEPQKAGFSFALYDTVMCVAIAIFSLFVGLTSSISQDFFDGVIMFIGIVIMLSSILPALIFDVQDRKSQR